MNKKLLFVGIIFIVGVAAVLALVVRQSAPPPSSHPEPTLAAPGPTGIFTQPAKVAFSFSAPPTIPASLPIYTFQPAPLSSVEKTAGNAAAALDLDATPSTLIRGGSYTKTWSRPDEAALAVTQTNGIISVTFRQVKSKQAPNTITQDAAVRQFLQTLVPATPNLSIQAAGTTSGPFDGLLVLDTPSPTSFKNYFYSYTVASYPLLTPDLSIEPVSVIADSGGIIRFANIVPPPASFQAGAAVPLLTGDQILENLAAGRGTLLDTHNPQTPEQGEIPGFSRFVIEESAIVYAPQKNLLLPAIYMTGTGVANTGSIQKATLFLWLIPAEPIQL